MSIEETLDKIRNELDRQGRLQAIILEDMGWKICPYCDGYGFKHGGVYDYSCPKCDSKGVLPIKEEAPE